ncbi:hypothetical protein [Kitasatospora sp. NPDC002965]|uniref:hypothetical protein n=1 Tax=Kitasatospora sp. NPDC002965 TaxID=3154775 RepID=UPI0033B3865B
MIKSLRPGQVRAHGALRIVSVSLVFALPMTVSCTTTKGERQAPVVGAWKSSVGTIQFLDGGTLGEVSLLPAACGGKQSPTAVTFTGTWRHYSLDDAGPGADVKLNSTTGNLTRVRFFHYFKHQGQERLQLTVTDAGDEPFVRQ